MAKRLLYEKMTSSRYVNPGDSKTLYNTCQKFKVARIEIEEMINLLNSM